MNSLTSILHNLKQKSSAKFLLAFSACLLTVAGIVWACTDDGESDYSAFAPEYFVGKDYTPFFYISYSPYYRAFNDYGDYQDEKRYNDQVVGEWYDYLSHRVSKEALKSLLFTTPREKIATVYKNASEKSDTFGKLNKEQAAKFCNYLLLAKSCEPFAKRKTSFGWDEKVPLPVVPAALESTLSTAFEKENDKFIKERLWFQCVRYAYFKDLVSNSSGQALAQKPPVLFDKFKALFPKNLMYYRTLGYVGGYYYHHKQYSQANYIYSLCYDYCFDMKIPSHWSFHPQNERDWNATMKLAQNNKEKITLWHLLGIRYDLTRGISEIAKLDIKSDKLDLLLSRLVNTRENMPMENAKPNSVASAAANEMKVVDEIALNRKTAKPYFWSLAAGYLHYMAKNYKVAVDFYNLAKLQYPAGNRSVVAQGKLLDLMLYISNLKSISPHAESKLVEPLTWLGNLRDRKDSVKDLRFLAALDSCTSRLAKLYHQQHDGLKEVCYKFNQGYFVDSTNVEKLKGFMEKPTKTPYEQVLTKYLLKQGVQVGDLYSYQAIVQVYKENFTKASIFMKMAKGWNNMKMDADPFTNRINDCHDCDHAKKQKHPYTRLSFIQELGNLRANLLAGRDKYKSSYLLANAYYNITHFGNNRSFYTCQIMGDAREPTDIYKPYQKWISYSTLAEKYYVIARQNATTPEQQAQCTYMAAKCEHNSFYMNLLIENQKKHSYPPDDRILTPPGKYFEELKNKYSNTQYYQEILKECGYFSKYISDTK